MIDEISIDRLVLDIPGMDAAQARDLARRIGEGLAASSSRSEGGNFEDLAIDLPHPAAGQNIPRLADAVVQALLAQMGGK